jgi:SAM-dependent methyltransferase
VVFELFEGLPRQGPGNAEATRKALACVPNLPDAPVILDAGCGTGAQTLVLAQGTTGRVLAVDQHESFVARLTQSATDAGLHERILPLRADMTRLPFPEGCFDLIWSEGAIYAIGTRTGLKAWRRLLKPQGSLVFSELSWLVDSPPAEAAAFWSVAYPAMQTVERNRAIALEEGYRVVTQFKLPDEGWWQGYYEPMLPRLQSLRVRYARDPMALQVLAEQEREIDIYRRHSQSFGYVFYVLQRQNDRVWRTTGTHRRVAGFEEVN